MDKQTSDERLLKLIEGSSGAKGKQFNRPQEVKPIASHLPVKLNLADLKSRFKNLKVNLLSLNKGLIGLGALLTLVFLYTLFSAPAVPKSNATFFNPADSSSVIKLISSGEDQGMMRKGISSQGIIKNFFLPFESRGSVYTQEAGQDQTEEIKDLKLVGIIWSKDPEVMIENTKDSRTYVLKKGELLDDQFKVKKISRNSATLEVTTQNGAKEYEIR